MIRPLEEYMKAAWEEGAKAGFEFSNDCGLDGAEYKWRETDTDLPPVAWPQNPYERNQK